MPIKVMIVDDNEDIRYTVKESLTSLDSKYRFLEAKSAQECFNILKKQKVDLILMDIMMPEMNGIEAVVKLREEKKTRKIPILFLTAKVDKISKKMASVIGNDFVEKPFEPSDLDNRIKEQLKK